MTTSLSLGQPEGTADVVVARQDHAVGDRGCGAIGIRVEHDDPIAHRPRGQREHPAELSAAEDADRRRRDDRASLDTELAVDVGDPGLLAIRVLVRLDRAALDDPGLERGIAFDKRRIGQQGVPERDVAPELLRVRQHVAVDAERRSVTDQRADQHRAARWPRVRTGLGPEPQLAEKRGDRGHIIGGRRDRQVDDALAGQTRHRGAADVLDDEVRSPLGDELGDGRRHLECSRVPRLHGGGPTLIGPDRRVHRASVDSSPMRQVIGRRVTEVDVG